jgi:hypothetical protein
MSNAEAIPMKKVVGACLVLLVGIALGWWLRGTNPSVFPAPRRPVETTKQAEQIIAASRATEAGTTMPTAAKVDAAKISPTDRVRILASINQHGHTRFYVNAIAGTKLDSGFIEMFGLSDAEAASLNATLAAANSRLTDIAISLASAQIDDEKTKISVHVPAFPDAGGAVHDQVLAAFKAVLGPDRYAAFNELSADGFENAFSMFGLNDTTYSLNFAPSSQGPQGRETYQIDMKYTSPNGTYGTSHSVLMGSSIPESFPVLAHYLPAELIASKK